MDAPSSSSIRSVIVFLKVSGEVNILILNDNSEAAILQSSTGFRKVKAVVTAHYNAGVDDLFSILLV
jgi:hypothetical protein